MRKQNLSKWLCWLGWAILLAACAPAATSAPSATQLVEVTKEVPAPTSAPEATSPASGFATQPAEGTVPAQETGIFNPTATPPGLATLTPVVVEGRVIELEWPTRLRLGDSDSVRLTLVATDEGYVISQEFPQNQIITQTVRVARPAGYELFGVARLESVGFEIAPAAEQVVPLPVGESVTWRWTLTPRSAGQHQLVINLFLRWQGEQVREAQLYSRALNLQVTSFFGLTVNQSMWLGMIGLFIGGGLCVAAVFIRPRPRRASPNRALQIEPPPGLQLAEPEISLMRLTFNQYARAVIETEFRSGYSGARALLVRPIKADGRADAHTILKIGPLRAIEREFNNYQRFVKDTLPPITARVQDELARLATKGTGQELAALRYTFIAQPGQRPISLREAFRQNPDPALLNQLFDNFGPNWWQQRRAHTFRLAQEYDALLPAHLTLEPLAEEQTAALKIDAHTPPLSLTLSVGAIVQVSRFAEVERRQDGRSLSLMGQATHGQPPLRVRWQSLQPPNHTTARVTATRANLLEAFTADFELYGLPNPLPRLPELLNETVVGTQSTIHGDLNLENVLVGPGGFVWLIDFAQTRDGHPLQDFAHLEAEIIAHCLAPQYPSPQTYIEMWRTEATLHPLLAALHQIVGRCLANPAQPREYHLALTLACLGALKYPNLDAHARHLLFLTAAILSQKL